MKEARGRIFHCSLISTLHKTYGILKQLLMGVKCCFQFVLSGTGSGVWICVCFFFFFSYWYLVSELCVSERKMRWAHFENISVVLNLWHGIVSARERHKVHLYENIRYKLLVLIHHEKCTHWHFLSWFQIEHLCLCQESKLETVFIVLYFLNTVQSETFAHLRYYVS